MNKYRLFLWMVILAILAGLVNTVFVFSYDGMTVSHVTGLISKFAISVSTGDLKGCIDFLSIIFAFFAGAVVAGVATGKRAFRMEKIYGFVVIAIGILVLLSLLLDRVHCTLLFAFLMGLQNGLVVTFKGILVRTTHMSGNLTDLGVFVGYKIRKNKEEKPISGLVPLATLTGFFLGGTVGILLYGLIGNNVFIAVSGVYILLGSAYFYLQKSCNDKNFNGIPDDAEK